MSADPPLPAPTLARVYSGRTRRRLFAACAAPWLFPATAARGTPSFPLLVACTIHALSVVSGFLLIVFLMAWGQRPYTNLKDVGRRFLEILQAIVRDLEQAPAGLPATLGIIAGVVLGVHLLLALLLMAWGARDEPLRRSLANSLRRTWLHTTHYLPVILMIAFGAIALEFAERRWRLTHPGPTYPTMPEPPRPPQLAQGDPDFANAQEKYQEAQGKWLKMTEPLRKQWQQANSAHWNSRPWYLRHDEVVMGTIVFAAFLWMLAALLRAIGARRDVATVARPPTCAECGYNLTTMPLDARCPECGRTVGKSIGPSAQPGMPWEHRHTSGRFRAWQATGVLTTRAPAEAGRTLRVSQNPVHHRRFLYMHLPAAVLIGACGYLGAEYQSSWWSNYLATHPTVLAAYLLGVGVMCGALVFSVTCLAATIVGLWHSWRCRRNLLPVAMSLACYLVPVLLAWEFITAVLIISEDLLWREGWFRVIPGIPADVCMGLFVGLPNVAFALCYWRLLARGTVAARYANV